LTHGAESGVHPHAPPSGPNEELATEYALPHEYKILDDDIEDGADGSEPGAGDTDDTE
jgi:hypothetical protein